MNEWARMPSRYEIIIISFSAHHPPWTSHRGPLCQYNKSFQSIVRTRTITYSSAQVDPESEDDVGVQIKIDGLAGPDS